MLLNLQQVAHNHFRWLVGGLFLSVIYDLLWLVLSAGASNQDYSGLESSVQAFGSFMSLLSFFTRLLMAVVYWKDSLDFDNIMLGRKVDRAIRTIGSNGSNKV
jgi:hypothetical protein